MQRLADPYKARNVRPVHGCGSNGATRSQVVRNKISMHPDTLPTEIVEHKTRGISPRRARRV